MAVRCCAIVEWRPLIYIITVLALLAAQQHLGTITASIEFLRDFEIDLNVNNLASYYNRCRNH